MLLSARELLTLQTWLRFCPSRNPSTEGAGEEDVANAHRPTAARTPTCQRRSRATLGKGLEELETNTQAESVSGRCG